MSRALHDLTISNLDDLPAACRSCTFWEVANSPRGPSGPAAAAAKEAWVQATQLEWGAPGKVLYVDDLPVGYGLLAPGFHLPRVHRLAHVPSDDAFLLATLWISPELRGSGLSKVLLQALLRETHRRGGRALEAYGLRAGQLPASCVLPEPYLLGNGFTVLHEHSEYPLLRLDMRQTARWQESMSHAVEGVLSALGGRERAPAPVRPSVSSSR